MASTGRKTVPSEVPISLIPTPKAIEERLDRTIQLHSHRLEEHGSEKGKVGDSD